MIDKTESDRSKEYWFSSRLYIALAVLMMMGAALCIFLLKTNTASAPDRSPVIEILNAGSGKVYLQQGILHNRQSMNDSGSFAIEFIHSVNNSPVREIFNVERASSSGAWEIRPAAVRFYSFGAGMPAELEDGQEMSRDGDALVITGFNRSYTELNYIVGTVSDHLLFVNGQVISLKDLCGKNTHITIRVR